ncbi:MAG: hypothetical protein ACLFTN_01615 [Phycisphaerae bacterium]
MRTGWLAGAVVVMCLAAVSWIGGGRAAGAEQADDANTPTRAQADPNEAKLRRERLARLVGQLDGNDVKKVLLAYDELMETGPPAVQPIYSMARKSRSRDTRIRSVVLIQEIIKRSKEKPAPEKVDAEKYPWTAPVGGIAMRLSVDRDVVQPGQLVRLRVDFRNAAEEAVPFAPLTILNTPRGGSSKAEGKLGPKRKPREVKAKEFKKRPLTTMLKPGQVVTYRFRLNEKLGMQHKVMLMHEASTRQRAGLPMAEVSTFSWALPEGSNELQFTYYAAGKGLLKDARKNLTQTVTVTVVEKTPDDRADAEKGS